MDEEVGMSGPDLVRALCIKRQREFLLTVETELVRLVEAPRGARLRLPELAPQYRDLLCATCSRFGARIGDEPLRAGQVAVFVEATRDVIMPVPLQAMIPRTWAGASPESWERARPPPPPKMKAYLEMMMLPGANFRPFQVSDPSRPYLRPDGESEEDGNALCADPAAWDHLVCVSGFYPADAFAAERQSCGVVAWLPRGLRHMLAVCTTSDSASAFCALATASGHEACCLGSKDKVDVDVDVLQALGLPGGWPITDVDTSPGDAEDVARREAPSILEDLRLALADDRHTLARNVRREEPDNPPADGDTHQWDASAPWASSVGPARKETGVRNEDNSWKGGSESSQWKSESSHWNSEWQAEKANADRYDENDDTRYAGIMHQNKKGAYGFINTDEGGEMFVMPQNCIGFAAAEDNGYNRVLPPVGVRVTYIVVKDSKTWRPRADNVRPESDDWKQELKDNEAKNSTDTRWDKASWLNAWQSHGREDTRADVERETAWDKPIRSDSRKEQGSNSGWADDNCKADASAAWSGTWKRSETEWESSTWADASEEACKESGEGAGKIKMQAFQIGVKIENGNGWGTSTWSGAGSAWADASDQDEAPPLRQRQVYCQDEAPHGQRQVHCQDEAPPLRQRQVYCQDDGPFESKTTWSGAQTASSTFIGEPKEEKRPARAIDMTAFQRLTKLPLGGSRTNGNRKKVASQGPADVEPADPTRDSPAAEAFFDAEEGHDFEASRRQCPQGHRLHSWITPSEGLCDGCNRPVPQAEYVMDCRGCEWFVCTSCYPQPTTAIEARVFATAEAESCESEVPRATISKVDRDTFTRLPESDLCENSKLGAKQVGVAAG